LDLRAVDERSRSRWDTRRARSCSRRCRLRSPRSSGPTEHSAGYKQIRQK